MPRREKIPKTYKVKSRTITKKINEAVHNPSKFQGMTQAEKNQILSAIQGKPDFQKLYSTLNPVDKQYVDLNIGNPEPGEPGFLRTKKPHLERISKLTPDQSRAAYSLLQQVTPEAFLPANSTPEQFQAAKQQGIGGTLAALNKPYESPLNTQMNQMFGHMANPVLQNYLNPSQGQNAQVLFPSQMQNQMNPGIQNLLEQLGSQGVQYGMQNAPELYEGAKQFGGQALQFGQQAGGNIMDLLSGLASRFRGPQQPPQQ